MVREEEARSAPLMLSDDMNARCTLRDDTTTRANGKHQLKVSDENE